MAAGFPGGGVESADWRSGIGMVKFPDIRPSAVWPDVPEHLFYEGPVMVQGVAAAGITGSEKHPQPERADVSRR